MALRFWSLSVLLSCSSFLVSNSSAATVPAGFVDTRIASGLSNPTAMAFAPDGRLFVCEQGGALRVIKDGSLLATPFVTLPVNASGERGLLGVAFDPDFASNHYVYVYYTATNPTHNRVSRFTAAGDVAEAGSETILLDLEPLSATNHNGGAIHFGKDGKLYVAVGENAVGSNSQTLNNRLGKMLRINADGSIPDDNPFYDIASGVNRSIWALGLRNPFTFAVNPLSGALFINDVGQNTWEEINLGTAGANYGWPATEGSTSNPEYQSPLYAYPHPDGCAISGGAFHNLLTPQFPFKYWGAYFFADLCGGWIRYRQSDGIVEDFASGISQPVDLKTASDGSLYYLARGGGGIVGRISYASPAPAVDFTANGGDGPVVLARSTALQLELTFDAGTSGPLSAAEMYIAVVTPSGLLWLDPAQGFRPPVRSVYAGELGDFSLSPWVTIPAGGLPAGAYWWIVLIDDDMDGTPDGDFSDFVVTVIQP